MRDRVDEVHLHRIADLRRARPVARDVGITGRDRLEHVGPPEQPDHRRPAGEHPALAPAAVPVRLPDRALRGDQPGHRIAEVHQHVRHAVVQLGHVSKRPRGPVRRRARESRDRLEVQAKAVELDVGSPRVAVRLLAAVAVVAADRERVAAADVHLVVADRAAEVKIERFFSLDEVSGLDQRVHREHPVAQPRDVPLPGRKRRDHLAVRCARLEDLAHAQDRQRLRADLHLGGVARDRPGALALPRRPGDAFVRQERIGDAPRLPGEDLILERGRVAVRRPAHHEREPLGAAHRHAARVELEAAHQIVDRSARERVGEGLVLRDQREGVRWARGAMRGGRERDDHRRAAAGAALDQRAPIPGDGLAGGAIDTAAEVQVVEREQRDALDIALGGDERGDHERPRRQRKRREIRGGDAQAVGPLHSAHEVGAALVARLVEAHVGEPAALPARADAEVHVVREVARLEARGRVAVHVLAEHGHAPLLEIDDHRSPAVGAGELPEAGERLRLRDEHQSEGGPRHGAHPTAARAEASSGAANLTPVSRPIRGGG